MPLAWLGKGSRSYRSRNAKPKYETSVKYVAQVVAERLAITAGLALKSQIDPEVFSKWTRKVTKEDIRDVGNDGDLVRVHRRPRFTAKEYAEMRESSIDISQECDLRRISLLQSFITIRNSRPMPRASCFGCS